MRKILIIVSILSMSLLMGCNSLTTEKIAQTEKTLKQEETSKQEPQKEQVTSKQENSELYELMGLLGKNDKEASPLLGGGKENKTEDGKYFIGRIYEAQIYGEDVTIYTNYDNNEKVSSITLNFAKSDAAYYQELVSKDLGLEATIDSESSESGATIYTWKQKDNIISLYDSAGLISLEMVLPVE